MLPSQAKSHIKANIQAITLDVIAEIESDLDACDLVSLVFLLYNSPDVALERLTMFLRIYEDLGEKNHLNLLQDWAKQNQSCSFWRYKFLEALTICQLYEFIGKLGFEVSNIKNHYQPNDLKFNFHINPMKKALYKLCEHITVEILDDLKSTLYTYDIEIPSERIITQNNFGELIFLELMRQRFIIVEDRTEFVIRYDIEELAKIIDNFPQIRKFSNDLREIQFKYNGEFEPKSKLDGENKLRMRQQGGNKVTVQDLDDVWEMVEKIALEEKPTRNLKSDTKISKSDMYPIKNPNRIGVCYIINQVDFIPSKTSIQSSKTSCPLESRLGSDKDKTELEKTMHSLKFEVISHRNLGCDKMIEKIKDIIRYRVSHDDSVFVLCILSHGVKDHVYAADAVLVNVQYIEDIVEKCLEERKLHDIPKVFILQACQVNNDETPTAFVADGPKRAEKYIIRKYHLLKCWATSPELEAFRDVRKGSIFIQILCYIIKRCSKNEHMGDILTKVANCVQNICTNKCLDQVPTYTTTLTKKLYLQIPG